MVHNSWGARLQKTPAIAGKSSSVSSGTDRVLTGDNAGWYCDAAARYRVKTGANKVDYLANPTYRKITIFKN
jgi:hypothetical protein